MPKKVAENQKHEFTLTMPYDLSGQTLQVVYISKDNTEYLGGTSSGAAEGNDVTIISDLSANGADLPPGYYDIEVKYDDNGEVELDIEGEDQILQNNAESVS